MGTGSTGGAAAAPAALLELEEGEAGGAGAASVAAAAAAAEVEREEEEERAGAPPLPLPLPLPPPLAGREEARVSLSSSPPVMSPSPSSAEPVEAGTSASRVWGAEVVAPPSSVSLGAAGTAVCSGAVSSPAFAALKSTDTSGGGATARARLGSIASREG